MRSPIRNIPSAAGTVIFLGFAVVGCADFQVIERSDGSQARLVRQVDKIFPIIASEVNVNVDLALKTKADAVNAGVKGGYQDKVVRLYQELDQLNAELRTFIVGSYLAYQNAELEGDLHTRTLARTGWQQALTEVHNQALETRRIALKLQEIAQDPTAQSRNIEMSSLLDEVTAARQGTGQLLIGLNKLYPPDVVID